MIENSSRTASAVFRTTMMSEKRLRLLTFLAACLAFHMVTALESEEVPDNQDYQDSPERLDERELPDNQDYQDSPERFEEKELPDNQNYQDSPERLDERELPDNQDYQDSPERFEEKELPDNQNYQDSPERLDERELPDNQNYQDSSERIQNQRNLCPRGFDLTEDGIRKCYRIVTDYDSWFGAQARCKALNERANLVTVLDTRENAYLNKILSSVGNCKVTNDYNRAGSLGGTRTFTGFWTSGKRKRRACGQKFEWEKSSGVKVPLAFTNWCKKQPDCAWAKEHCISFSENCENGNRFGFHDNPCDWTFCSVCEVPKGW